MIELNLDRISLEHETLRLYQPHTYKAMERSMHRYGQMTAVVVSRADAAGVHALVDGFKRYRAAQRLGKPSLCARVFEGEAHAIKAAMVRLNKATAANVLEESLIVSSLHNEDGLRQDEIGALFDRHKSWVCRRIALIERLHEEVIASIRLGLIGAGIGRELARLPRGNQTEAMQCIVKHRLCYRETQQLVSHLMQCAPWERSPLLDFPLSILEKRQPLRPRAPVDAVARLMAHLRGIQTLADDGRIIAALANDRNTDLRVAIGAAYRTLDTLYTIHLEEAV